MKLSKRILSFILAFTILSSMFACVDTGIGKVNAAGSQVNDTVGRPDSPQTPDGEQGTDSSSPRSVAPTQLNNIDSGEDTASDEGEYSKQTNSMGNVLISEFKGYYDGNGMTITVPSSVSISNNNCAGIFGKVSSGAMIKNLNTHISGSITSSSGSAGFIGILEGGTIDNVQVTFNGSLSAPIAGALIGSVTSSGSTSVVKNSAVISNNQVKFIGAKSGTNSLTNNWALIKSVPSNTSLDLGSNNVMYVYPNGSVQLSRSGGAFTFSATPDSGWTAQYQNSDGEVVYSLPNYTVPISTNGVIYFVKFLKEVNFTASTGGAISPAGIRTLQQGETVDVVATAATGYSFSEFILTGIPASDLVPNSANPNQAVFTMGTAGGTVHAVFAPNTYTVKFNPNGDNVENLPENISATYDVAFSIPSTIPTRDGYVFKYWCTKNVDDGTGIGYSAGTTNLKNLVSENGGEYNFYAIWTVNKYTVSFNANNGSSVAPFMMDYGANFSFPNTVRTGYTFGGWFDNPEFTGTGHAIGSSATVTGNITYHAKWLNNKYTVTFNENGGYNAPSPITAYYDTAFDIPVITPEKMGHTFLGWDNQPTSQEIVYFAGDTGIINLSLGGDPSAAMVPNINLYAVWRVNSYIITWNLAGGSIAGSTQNPQTTVVYGQNYVLPSGTPVRTGYTFTGWYTSSGQGGTLINEGTTVNVTVSSTHYAHWSVNTYTVVFDKNDSAATGTMDPLICTYGIPFSLPLNEYAKTGFRFDGWALSTTGEPVYSNGDEVFQSLTTGNDVTVTLYAKWTPNRFILTFNSNGGTGNMAAMQIEFNSSVVLPTNKFTKSGYTFMGWATSLADAQAGNATYTNGASYTMSTTGATLYAVWSSNPYNVTFYGNGNDGDSSMGVQMMSFGQTANLNRNTYRRTGYSFIGWSTSPGIATVVYNDEASVTMNTQGINLYAQWQPNLYTISYNANTSDMTVINVPSSQNAVYDTAINLSSMIPQRTGYSFAGWARVSTAIVSEFSVGQAVTNLTSTHNEVVILYALWSPNVYDVIWALRGGSINDSPQSVVNSVNYNGTYVFPETNPIRTGYVFNGWFSSTAPNATQITASTTHTMTISRTIYAKWTPITYYVVYNKNAFDAIGTMEKSIHSYDDFNTQIAQNAFTRPGYNFVGWALSADGEVEYGDMDYIPSLTSVLNADVQLYAKWTPRTDTAFIVRHMGESEGGGGYNDLLLLQEYNNGTTGDSIYAADYKNTTFSGFTWNNVNSSAVIKGDGTTILEIYYNRNYYTVTFYGNGGKTSGNQTTQTQSLKYGVEASLVGNSFIKPGYSFLMWNTSPDGSGTSYENNALYTIGTESVYLYAIWEVFESSYTVEHYLESLDASYPETPTYSDKINTSTDSVVNAAPRTELGFTVDWYAPGTITSGTVSPDNSLVLRLFYKRNSYNVTFNAGDGLGESYTQTFKFGEQKELVAVSLDFYKTGYSFTGWATSPTGAIKYLDGGWFTMNMDGITLYAKWSINYYSIYFETFGGSAVNAITQPFNSLVAPPIAPTKTGYSFRAWMHNGTDYIFTTMPDEDITLVADWIICSYTVTFNANGATSGSVPSVKSGEFNKNVTLEAATNLILDNPEGEQYFRFVGWNTEPDGSGDTYTANDTFTIRANNETLYALWGANYYLVNYYIDVATQDYLPASTVNDPEYALGGIYERFSTNSDGKYLRIDFVESTVLALENSIIPTTDSANLFRKASEQTVVDRYWNAIMTALDNLELKPVNLDLEYECYSYTGEEYPPCDGFHSYNELIVNAQEMIESGGYDEDSLSYILSVIEESQIEISADLKIPSQSLVEYYVLYMADAYHQAIAEDADFSQLHLVWSDEFPWESVYYFTQESIEAATNYYYSKAALEGTIKKIDQYEVDAFVSELRHLISNLEYKSADYSALLDLLALIPPGYNSGEIMGWEDVDTAYLQENYSFNSIEVLRDAVEQIDWNLDITEQELVDGTVGSYVTMVAAAIGQLELKSVTFTVNHYWMNTDGLDYTLFESEILNGSVGQTVTVTPKVYSGMTYNADASSPSGIVLADSSLTLNLYYWRNECTIAFESNGGTSVEPITALFGAPISEPEKPTRPGFEFDGWYRNSALTQVYIFATMSPIDITLYAKWNPISYTMNFLLNDGSSEVYYTTDFLCAEQTAPPSTNPVRVGYTFTGWFEDAYATGNPYAFGSMPAQDINLYAGWNPNHGIPYVVIHKCERLDGTYEIVETQHKTGTTGDVAVATAYNYPGFKYYPNDSVISGVILGDGSLELTVCYKRNSYSITYLVDGEEYRADTYRFGATVTPPPEPIKDGYTFNGWSQEIPEIMPAEDLTITAEFVQNGYEIFYYVDGELIHTDVYQSGAPVTPPEPPVKEGHTFSGWIDVPATMPAENITVNGYFTVNNYKISYYVDGELYQEVEIPFGQTIVLIDEPTKEGYSFSGWSQPSETTMPSHDITITGSFTVNTYTITYEVDGEFHMTQTYNYGEEITPPVEPTKEGYSFSGWIDVPATMPAENIEVSGHFTVNEYKISYYVDGELYQEVDVPFGQEIVLINEPLIIGHTFSGWSEYPETMPSHNITVTGSFTVNTYTITYYVDGVEYFNETYEYDAPVTPIDWPEKTGYSFSGWTKVPETMPAQDYSVTGYFTVNEYTITYYVDEVEYFTETYEYGAPVTPIDEPTKTGYTFSGWQNVPDTMPAEDVTVTGSFAVNNYKISYYVDDEFYQEVEVPFGQEIVLINEPIKTGYTFSGWSEHPETMPAEDITITGYFTVNTYTITYEVDGQFYTSQTYNYGADITPAEYPTREGYTFSGWSEMPGTMPAQDLEVTGYFTVNQYSIFYYVDAVEYHREDYDYQAQVTPIEWPTREGYTFSGWSEIPETMPAHNLTVTGSFTVNSYTITYIVDGDEHKTETYAFGELVIALPPLTKTGYTFGGWSNIPETMPSHDVEVTGSFTINTYTITYYVDDVEYLVEAYEYGALVAPPAQPTKEGYTFSGWSPSIPETMPAQDVIITGSLSINNYKIWYYVDDELYYEDDVPFGETIFLIEEPTKEGYTFSGWSEHPETMPADNVMITGTFICNEYKISYYIDDEWYWEEDVPFGQTIVLIDEPTKTGHTFSGWSEHPETMPAEEITITGYFTVNTYTITYEVDGQFYASQTYDYGANVIPPAEPTMHGYSFSGWLNIPETMPAENLVITGEFILISLTAREGSTTIIDNEDKFIYGLEPGLDIATFESVYVQANGNAHLRYQTYSMNLGTGTKVELVDNRTDEVLDTYYIVIFGDLDGNGMINSLDASILLNATTYNTDLEDLGVAFSMAGNIDGFSGISSIDASILIAAVAYNTDIDQQTGRVIS